MSALPGLEGITVSRWLHQRLSGDPTLAEMLGGAEQAPRRIVEGVYDGDATLWVVFTVLEPRDVKAVGMIQVMSEVQVQVKAVTTGSSYGPVIPVYQRVHQLLEAQQNGTPPQGGIVLTAHRLSGVQFPERTQGIQYRHLGGLYETLTQ